MVKIEHPEAITYYIVSELIYGDVKHSQEFVYYGADSFILETTEKQEYLDKCIEMGIDPFPII